MNIFERPRTERSTDNDLQALRRAVDGNPDDTEAIGRWQLALERAGRKGAIVPVETSSELAVDQPEHRRIEWVKVDDKEIGEIKADIEKIFRIQLHNEPFSVLIADSGEVSDPYINEEHFPMEESEGEIELLGVRFEYIFEKPTNQWLKANGLRAASLKELLAFSSQLHPQHREGRYVALGQKWVSPKNRDFVPMVESDGDSSFIKLERLDYLVTPGYVLAVREKKDQQA